MYNDNEDSVIKQTDDLICVSEENGVLKIDVKGDIPICDYLDYLDANNLGDIPLKVLFMDGYNFLDSSLIPQTIYTYKNNNILYYVTDTKKTLRVVESITGEEEINELILDMNKLENSFRVTKAAHDLSLSTKYCISYPLDIYDITELSLDREEAFDLVKSLIMRAGQIKELDHVLNYHDLYKYTNIVHHDRFNPIISDDVITISKMFVKDNYDVSKETDQFFDIILNSTGEIIGELTFTLYKNNFISDDNQIRYSGNVSYKIKDRYSSNHYATRALKLLVEIIRNNSCDVDKSIYVSTEPSNIASQKVAINNGAKMFYTGIVPDNNSLRTIDGVQEVNIYRIKI